MKERNSPINIDSGSFRKNGHLLIDQIAEFLDALPDKKVTTAEQPMQIKSSLGNDELPVDGMPLDEILPHSAKLLFEHSLFNGHPRFWGYITSSPSPAGMLADLLAASVNSNVGAFVLSPMATEIERQTIRWIAEFIGFPENCGGLIVSGGNMANITGLLAARKAKASWDIRQIGLNNQVMLIYCAKGTHTWIQKAADLLGFGTNNIRWIDIDEHQQMNIDALEAQIISDKKKGHLPFVVVGTAGSVSTGVVDPLDRISDICKKYDLWFHVDGAYGAPAVVVPEVTSLFKGMSLADSIALDPHKWLYLPLEAGCILVRDNKALNEAFSFHPVYYNFEGKENDPVINYLDSGFQNSRGFRALKVWISMKQVGKNGYIKMIQDDIQLAKMLFDKVSVHPEMEAVSSYLSITTFRFIPEDFTNKNGNGYLNKLNEEVLNRIQSGGEAFVSNAVIGTKYCLRACIVNFKTTEEDIEALIQIVLRVGRSVHSELSRVVKYL